MTGMDDETSERELFARRAEGQPASAVTRDLDDLLSRVDGRVRRARGFGAVRALSQAGAAAGALAACLALVHGMPSRTGGDAWSGTAREAIARDVRVPVPAAASFAGASGEFSNDRVSPNRCALPALDQACEGPVFAVVQADDESSHHDDVESLAVDRTSDVTLSSAMLTVPEALACESLLSTDEVTCEVVRP